MGTSPSALSCGAAVVLVSLPFQAANTPRSLTVVEVALVTPMTPSLSPLVKPSQVLLGLLDSNLVPQMWMEPLAQVRRAPKLDKLQVEAVTIAARVDQEQQELRAAGQSTPQAIPELVDLLAVGQVMAAPHPMVARARQQLVGLGTLQVVVGLRAMVLLVVLQ